MSGLQESTQIFFASNVLKNFVASQLSDTCTVHWNGKNDKDDNLRESPNRFYFNIKKYEPPILFFSLNYSSNINISFGWINQNPIEVYTKHFYSKMIDKQLFYNWT